MTLALLLVPLLLAAAALLGPAPRRLPGPGAPGDAGLSSTDADTSSADDADAGLLRRGRLLWAVLAGGGAAAFLGGPLAVPAGLAVAVVVAIAAGRLESPQARRRREEVRRDLPHLVTLFAATLRAGHAPPAAIGLVCRALPGAAAERLAPLAARLELGGDPHAVWSALGADPELGPFGRALARAHRTGAPVVSSVEELAAELGHRARGEVEDRARAVGVRAAVPLGVCLLPSFLLLGIVPLAASLTSGIVGSQ